MSIFSRLGDALRSVFGTSTKTEAKARHDAVTRRPTRSPPTDRPAGPAAPGSDPLARPGRPVGHGRGRPAAGSARSG